jgi:hypothetical protein
VVRQDQRDLLGTKEPLVRRVRRVHQEVQAALDKWESKVHPAIPETQGQQASRDRLDQPVNRDPRVLVVTTELWEQGV